VQKLKRSTDQARGKVNRLWDSFASACAGKRQKDKAFENSPTSGYEPEGREFDSLRARHSFSCILIELHQHFFHFSFLNFWNIWNNFSFLSR